MTDDTRTEVWCVRIDCREDEVDCTRVFLTPVAAARQVVGEILTERRGNVSTLERSVSSRADGISDHGIEAVQRLDAVALEPVV